MRAPILRSSYVDISWTYTIVGQIVALLWLICVYLSSPATQTDFSHNATRTKILNNVHK